MLTKDLLDADWFPSSSGILLLLLDATGCHNMDSQTFSKIFMMPIRQFIYYAIVHSDYWKPLKNYYVSCSDEIMQCNADFSEKTFNGTFLLILSYLIALDLELRTIETPQ